MTSDEVAEGVAEWAMEVVPGLQGAYAFLPSVKTKRLPDVVVDVADTLITDRSVEFPMQAFQQRWLHIFHVEASFMVDGSNAEAATSFLRTVEATTTAALLRDGSLGGRVDFTSPFFSHDFTPPFVEYDDGTRGREMVMRLTVGEFVEVG